MLPWRVVLDLMSQTKPGPNMALAVAMKVFLRESGEEKERVNWPVSWLEGGAGVGDTVVIVWCEFQAMEAWLKREAEAGLRQWVRRRSRVGRSPSLVAGGGDGRSVWGLWGGRE